MATKYFIGCDPGKTGGWGIVDVDGTPIAAAPLPYQEKLLDWQQLTRQWGRALELTSAFGTEGALHVCAEHPIVRSGESDTGHFNSGVNFGLIRAAAQTVGARLTTPQPHIWKSKMRLGKDKALSMRLCDELFPQMYDTIRGPRGGALDGIAEAILIAEYARRAELRLKSNERGGIEDFGDYGKAEQRKVTGTLHLPAEPGSLREWAGTD